MYCLIRPVGSQRVHAFAAIAAGAKTTMTLLPIFLSPPDLHSLPLLTTSHLLCLFFSPLFPAWLWYIPGPPGPPTSIQVEKITDTTASLSWRPGPDNHSPITAYTIQARTPFSLGWQAVTTGKLSPTSRGLLQSQVKVRSSFLPRLWKYWRGNFFFFLLHQMANNSAGIIDRCIIGPLGAL